jgi:hypothetical protein
VIKQIFDVALVLFRFPSGRLFDNSLQETGIEIGLSTSQTTITFLLQFLLCIGSMAVAFQKLPWRNYTALGSASLFILCFGLAIVTLLAFWSLVLAVGIVLLRRFKGGAKDA